MNDRRVRIYYNDNDPYCAEWLRRLIAAGHLPPGDVDDRDIREVRAEDLRGYTSAHFFAGIGGWPYALRLAGWPDDEPVWTGSCPCQPFSAAGRGRGVADDRHLWPEFYRLIAECRPPVVFGEQVASKAGRAWLGAVQADLEALGYAVGRADVCAAGVGAPHIRQRLWWVADARYAEQEGRGTRPGDADANRLDDPASSRRNGTEQGPEGHPRDEARVRVSGSGCRTGGLGDCDSAGLEGRGLPAGERASERSPWASSDFVWCRDGKYRPVEPGTFPLAHGVPARVGRLRAYGNAIVPQVAEAFIRAYRDIRGR